MILAVPDAPLWVAGALSLATAVSSWRKLVRGQRDLSLWLQVPAAVLLYFALFPPHVSLRADSLTVMTPTLVVSPQSSVPHDAPVIALPGAQAPVKAEPEPDLATALRAHPSVNQLTVIGGGLPARDREAAVGRTITFLAAPDYGLLELHAPNTVPLGRQWALSGRAASSTRRVELLDPSGSIVDKADVDSAGRFKLSAAARGIGNTRFELRVFGDKNLLQDTLSIPLTIVSGESISVIARFGTPNPELKYWQRWALDAGLNVALSAGLSEGVNLNAGDVHLTPAALSHTDVVMIDSRAWATLDPSEKSALRAAVDQGLGLLLRADAPLAAQSITDWGGLGFSLSGTSAPTSVILDQYLNLRDHTPFTAAGATFSQSTGAVQFKADDGTPLAWWHDQGRGRVALWRLIDSYRLTLLGDQDRYANLWASTLEMLARPRAPPPPGPQLPENNWVLERAVFCDLRGSASVRAPDDQWLALTVGADACAAFWPAVPGWHSLKSAGSEWPFYVRAADDGRTLHAALDAGATSALPAPTPDASQIGAPAAAPAKTLQTPMASWPWFLLWLAAMSVIWWQERRQDKIDRNRAG